MFQKLKEQNIGGVAQSIFELETTLNGAITSTATTLTLTDSSAFPSSGYIYVQTKPTPQQTRDGENTFTLSEVIKYTANKLAQLKKISFEEINKITTNNFNSLFFN